MNSPQKEIHADALLDTHVQTMPQLCGATWPTAPI